MKNSLLIGILFLGFYALNAQDADLKITSSAGSTFSNPTLQVDWTLGEPIILTLDNSNVMMSNGFHQPTYGVPTQTSIIPQLTEVRVTPNPVNDIMNIYLQFSKPVHGLLELSDMHGKIIWRKNISGEVCEDQYSLSNSPAGQYLLSISLPLEKSQQTISILKI